MCVQVLHSAALLAASAGCELPACRLHAVMYSGSPEHCSAPAAGQVKLCYF